MSKRVLAGDLVTVRGSYGIVLDSTTQRPLVMRFIPSGADREVLQALTDVVPAEELEPVRSNGRVVSVYRLPPEEGEG
jgi:hypothetical protein